MTLKGIIHKMSFTNLGEECRVKPSYNLKLGPDTLELNRAIGHPISIEFTGRLECVACGRNTNKSFGQGYCYPCFTTVPQTEECVLRPELCQAHLGIARDMEYAKEHCLSTQYIYLALSGGLKVGVTRHSQVPYRWVDQGATQAIPIATTTNRYNAGLVEVALKSVFSDKTNWRRMLKGEDGQEDLLACRDRALASLEGSGLEYEPSRSDTYSISFPYNGMPGKLVSTNLDKEHTVSGVLHGIKGQYLIFNDGRVINIRRHTGYEVEVVV